MEPSLENLHQDSFEHIITKLPLKDVSNLSMASKLMKAKTSRPKFWQPMVISKIKMKQEGLPKLLCINRFKEVRRIDMSQMTMSNDKLIKNLSAITTSLVKELNLKKVNISQVPKEFVRLLGSQLTKIKLCGTPSRRISWSTGYPDGVTLVTVEQCVELLQTCVSPGTLTEVNLAGSSALAQVPAELLGRAVGHLTKVNLDYTRLNHQQSFAVIEACISSPSLENISLEEAKLWQVPPHMLGQAARRMKSINLASTYLTKNQIIAVLEACVQSSTLELVSLADILNFRGWEDDDEDIDEDEDVSPQLLADAVANLLTVNLNNSYLSPEQTVAVLQRYESSKLTALYCSTADFSQVSPQLLEQAAGKLQKIGLVEAELTTHQIIGVLKACTLNLTQVSLEARLYEVPVELLTTAACNLRAIYLGDSEMTTEQKIGLLNTIITAPQLSEISLYHVYLEEIPVDLLTNALNHLQIFDLTNAMMTIPQKSGLLTSLLTSTAVLHLTVLENEKDALPDGLFLQAQETGRLHAYDEL